MKHGPSPSPSGYTLLELTTVLLILGLALFLLLPTARSQIDRLAVVGAREEVTGLFHRARMAAVARGGASIHLTARPPSVEIRTGLELLARTDLAGGYGVTLTLSQDRETAVLGFDALGLGRVSSQTLVLTRGKAEARLVVSSFGRVSKP